eukprot:8354439-Ditylum_brightwellii.AAC.1
MKRNLENDTHIGPEMEMKDPDHTRFYFINTNGISLKEDGLQYKSISEDAKQREREYTGLPEIKLDTLNPSILNIIHDTTKKKFQHAIVQSTSAP